MRPKATAHYGICSQCDGEGDVITVDADPLDLSLCGDSLAPLRAGAAGLRSTIRERWGGLLPVGGARALEFGIRMSYYAVGLLFSHLYFDSDYSFHLASTPAGHHSQHVGNQASCGSKLKRRSHLITASRSGSGKPVRRGVSRCAVRECTSC